MLYLDQLFAKPQVQVSNFCIRTTLYIVGNRNHAIFLCFIPNMLDMDIILIVYGATGISIVNYLCIRELNFKKSLSDPGEPRHLNSQNRTSSSGIFLDLSDVQGTSQERIV